MPNRSVPAGDLRPAPASTSVTTPEIGLRSGR